MPKYVIERELPGAGKLSAPELKAISQKSCGVLSKIGSTYPVAREFCHRRQDLLRIHRPQ